MVISKIKSAISKIRGKNSNHARPLVSGKEITVSLQDPYRQPQKVDHKPIKVNAPFTIEPSSIREVKLKKAKTKPARKAYIKLKPFKKHKAKKRKKDSI